jgi:pimeloyl-ACP methyl ester carboxylesterase
MTVFAPDRRRLLAAFAISTFLLSACAREAATNSIGDPPAGFTSDYAEVNGARLHYVRGGQGPAIILLHGFPQDWVEYKAIMPRLAQQFTVVAVDLPGLGASEPSTNGYEATNLAAYVHGLSEALSLERPYLVGHDLGGVVAYAYVRQFEHDLRGAMIFDVPMPGLAGWEESTDDLWHLGFLQTPGLAEELLAGRQEAYLDLDLATKAFTPEERDYYLAAYREPQLHAGFEIYRAFPRDGEWNAGQSAPNALPVVIAAGERSFGPFLSAFVEGYRAKGMTQVEGVLIPSAGHFVVEDNAQAVVELIERNAGRRQLEARNR